MFLFLLMFQFASWWLVCLAITSPTSSRIISVRYDSTNSPLINPLMSAFDCVVIHGSYGLNFLKEDIVGLWANT